ncbi:hypothetical protein E4K10_35650 [Streptomyces sp. T1317-0309]|nr:hypothetical protein E4K10_35650 [Streptomyces sp. T1317-0309]
MADSSLRRITLTGSDGRQVGQASYTPGDWARREQRMPTVLAGGTYSDHRSDRAVLVGSPHALPWREGGATFFAGHGTPTRVTLALADGTTVQVTGRELARYLERGDLGPKDRPIVLYSCSTGRPPEHGGLSVAQHVANLTGRVVHAPTTEAGTAVDSKGQIRPILYLDPDRAPGAWTAFTPEPSGDALDDLARHAGLHDGPEAADPWARNRTLQLIRTLRGTLGTGIEGSAEHRALLRDLAALDTLRWNPGADGAAAGHTDGRMTPGLLRRITRDLLGLPDTAAPDAEQYRTVLTEAGRAHDTDPAAPLHRLSLSSVPGASPSPPGPPGESTPATDTLPDGGAKGSPEATAVRTVARQLPAAGGRPRLDVLNVAGDGDCFFTSVLASAARQQPASEVRNMTVRRLRDHAADWFADSELRDEEPMRMDPLDVLVGDLDTVTLRHVLGGVPLPALTLNSRPGWTARPGRTGTGSPTSTTPTFCAHGSWPVCAPATRRRRTIGGACSRPLIRAGRGRPRTSPRSPAPRRPAWWSGRSVTYGCGRRRSSTARCPRSAGASGSTWSWSRTDARTTTWPRAPPDRCTSTTTAGTTTRPSRPPRLPAGRPRHRRRRRCTSRPAPRAARRGSPLRPHRRRTGPGRSRTEPDGSSPSRARASRTSPSPPSSVSTPSSTPTVHPGSTARCCRRPGTAARWSSATAAGSPPI